jgi:hypothetical protein
MSDVQMRLKWLFLRGCPKNGSPKPIFMVFKNCEIYRLERVLPYPGVIGMIIDTNGPAVGGRSARGNDG